MPVGWCRIRYAGCLSPTNYVFRFSFPKESWLAPQPRFLHQPNKFHHLSVGRAFLFHPPFLLSLMWCQLSDLSGIIWGGKCGHNHGIVDAGIFRSFHVLLSSSTFPFGCNSHQVVDLRKWARKNTRDDQRKEVLGQDSSLPEDFVMWLLHCFYLQ